MWRALARLEDVVAGGALVIFSVAILTGVVYRYVLDSPLSWTDEVSLFTFAWLIFIGAAICARENAHIVIDLVSPEPGSGLLRWSEALAAMVAASVSILLAWVSYRYMMGAASMMTPVFRLSSAVYNSAAPVGFLLIGLHLGRHVVDALTGKDVGPRPESL